MNKIAVPGAWIWPVVDPLRSALDAGVYLTKPSLHEMRELAGEALERQDDVNVVNVQRLDELAPQAAVCGIVPRRITPAPAAWRRRGG
jgi:hypothetical protein